MPKSSKTQKSLATGALHKVAQGLRKALNSSAKARSAWEDITPLARNEWICWVTSVKKSETRADHIKRTIAELAEGKYRPCCWPGCPHRRPSAQKWFYKKK